MKKNLTRLTVSGLCCICLAAGVFTMGSVHAQQKQNVTITGSDTMVLLGQRWAENYMKKNPGVSIQISGGGSGVGIAALLNGTVDIAQSSRPMKDSEKEQLKSKRSLDAVELSVALDGVAVYINEGNPVKELTLEQLLGIYTGKITNWKEVGGRDGRIMCYGRENSSGTYAYFQEHVLKNADFHPTTQALPGTAAVINAVSKDARGIGYGGVAYLKGVRALLVKENAASPGIAPTLENVQKNTYPISRFLYWYMAGTPSGQVKQIADWALSNEGQSVIEDVGYYPIPAAMRNK